MNRFMGSEKQVQWAEDIVKSSKESLDKELREILEYEKDENQIERVKSLYDLQTGVLEDLHEVWHANDVIKNRFEFERGHVLNALGIDSRGGGRVKIGEKRYTIAELNDSEIRTEMKVKILETVKRI